MVFLTGDSMLPLCYHYDPEHFNDYVGCLAVQHPPITTGVLLTRCHGEPRALLCQRLDALRVAQSTALKELTAYNTVNTINLKTYKILRIVSIHVCDYVYKIQHHSNTILTVMKQWNKTFILNAVRSLVMQVIMPTFLCVFTKDIYFNDIWNLIQDK